MDYLAQDAVLRDFKRYFERGVVRQDVKAYSQ